jgi:multimeric flavodoxin WrbA
MNQVPAIQTGTKKVTVFVGSAHKRGATYRAAGQFLENLESYGDVHGEIVVLSDYGIGVCRGCKNCTDRGEERCPLKDDRDALIGKMMASDGVVFASANYSFQVYAIVVQAIGRGGTIVKYLEFVSGGLGFNVVKGSCSRTLEPMDQNVLDRMERNLALTPRAHAVQDGPDGLSADARREHARPRVFSRPGLV